jgi:hypothetical protein
VDSVDLSTEQLLDVLKMFGVAGADVGQGHDPQALVRLRLAQAILGAAEAQMLFAEQRALEAGVSREEIAATAAAVFMGADATEGAEPLFLLQARVMSVFAGIAAMEPDPRGPAQDIVLDIASEACAGLAGLIAARRQLATGKDPEEAVGKLAAASQLLEQATGRIDEVFGLADLTGRAGRGGRGDLN